MIPSWVTAVLFPVLSVFVLPVAAWAFRLQLKCAELQARVSVLERERSEDATTLKDLAATAQQLLVAMAEVKTELRLLRKGDK